MIYYFYAGAIILMIVGLVGIVIPIFPGIPLMLAVALLYHFLVQGLPAGSLVVLISIGVLSVIIDQLSGILGSRIAGASGKSMLLGFVGMLLGLGITPPLGSIIGLFVGILAGELAFKQSPKHAIKAAGTGAFSVIIGMTINLILALLFLVIFIFTAI